MFSHSANVHLSLLQPTNCPPKTTLHACQPALLQLSNHLHSARSHTYQSMRDHFNKECWKTLVKLVRSRLQDTLLDSHHKPCVCHDGHSLIVVTRRCWGRLDKMIRWNTTRHYYYRFQIATETGLSIAITHTWLRHQVPFAQRLQGQGGRYGIWGI